MNITQNITQKLQNLEIIEKHYDMVESLVFKSMLLCLRTKQAIDA